MSLPDEEEKGDPAKLDSLEVTVKDLINKLKLYEGFTKAIDRLVALASSERHEFFLALNSQVVKTVGVFLELIPGINPKALVAFQTKTVVERVLKAQGKILEHFSKVKDLSSIMSMEVDDEGRGDTRELQEQATLLAKSMEVIKSEGVTELLKAAQSLKYLSKLMSGEKETMAEVVQTIAFSFCKALQAELTEVQLSKMSASQVVEALVLVSRLVIVNRALSEVKMSPLYVQKVEAPKNQSVQESR
jgi:hypothetical protein